MTISLAVLEQEAIRHSFFGEYIYKPEENKSKIFYYLSEEDAVMILAFIGGYVDAAGYIKLAGLFTSSITGNLVAACDSVYESYGIVGRTLVCLAFVVGCFITMRITLALKYRGGWRSRQIGILLFLLEGAVILLSMAFGFLYDEDISNHNTLYNPQLIYVACIVAASMGVHNAAAKECIHDCPSTTVMTMTLLAVSSQWAKFITYYLGAKWKFQYFSKIDGKPKNYDAIMELKYAYSREKVVVLIKPLVVFLTAALLGSVIMYNITFWSMLFPAFLCFILSFDMYIGFLRKGPGKIEDYDLEAAINHIKQKYPEFKLEKIQEYNDYNPSETKNPLSKPNLNENDENNDNNDNNDHNDNVELGDASFFAHRKSLFDPEES